MTRSVEAQLADIERRKRPLRARKQRIVGCALGERGPRQLRLGEAVGDAMGLAAQRRQLLA